MRASEREEEEECMYEADVLGSCIYTYVCVCVPLCVRAHMQVKDYCGDGFDAVEECLRTQLLASGDEADFRNVHECIEVLYSRLLAAVEDSFVRVEEVAKDRFFFVPEAHIPGGTNAAVRRDTAHATAAPATDKGDDADQDAVFVDAGEEEEKRLDEQLRSLRLRIAMVRSATKYPLLHAHTHVPTRNICTGTVVESTTEEKREREREREPKQEGSCSVYVYMCSMLRALSCVSAYVRMSSDSGRCVRLCLLLLLSLLVPHIMQCNDNAVACARPIL